MRPEQRRRVISSQLNEPQRHALEQHMLAKRKSQDIRPVKPLAHAALCDSAQADDSSVHSSDSGSSCKLRGVVRTASGKVNSYYAKASVKNLLFTTRVSLELEGAVRDHIVLVQIVERIRREASGRHFPTVVRAAVASVLHQSGLEPRDFFRCFYVFCSAHHWLGHKLEIYRNDLEAALEAWRRLDSAKGHLRCFKQGYFTEEYTPEKSADQWARVRAAYVTLRAQDGRSEDVEAWLSKSESRRRPMIERVAGIWKQRAKRVQKPGFPRAGDEDKLLRRVERVLAAWTRAMVRAQRKLAPRHPKKQRTKRQREADVFDKLKRSVRQRDTGGSSAKWKE